MTIKVKGQKGEFLIFRLKSINEDFKRIFLIKIRKVNKNKNYTCYKINNRTPSYNYFKFFKIDSRGKIIKNLKI